MKYDISKFEELVEQKYLRKSEKGSLILYGYTDHCTFERYWNEYTRVARGLILDKNTGEVVAKCFEKFFSVGEMEETFLANLPLHLKYEAFEKNDGSLGILFYHNGEWQVATRGSFYSDQAVKAQELLKKYDLTYLNKDITVLVEIIYPENKIIVDYGQEEKLVALAMFWRTDGEELPYEAVKNMSEMNHKMPVTRRYDYTIEQMIELQKTMPKDQEGFVVRFENGLRVKIKSNEYLRIAKLMSSLSPLALWETMKNGKVDTFYLQQLPEELRKDYEPYVTQLEQQWADIVVTIAHEIHNHELINTTPDWRRTVGLYLANNDVKHSAAIFPCLLGNHEALNKYVMKQIRPTGNEMVKLEQT